MKLTLYENKSSSLVIKLAQTMANPWNSQVSLIWAMWNACEGEKKYSRTWKYEHIFPVVWCVCVNIENTESTVDDCVDSSTFYILTYVKTL